ncbi:class I SAM-dependent methyltransferase [Ulvibacterium sp.]|uniref:class I SAM-dependent methyltransferase n=1 Tax=Ulvibacterium sp. TaxID=2665914 RepID=UPI002635F4A8|nr:class I SAM-dependent methyltransferase [Ulvibacterium sp.]
MKLYLKTKDYAVSQEEFHLLHDADMDMLITEPSPDALGKYYQSEAYISHTDANKSLIEKLYQAVKKYNLAKKVKLIERYGQGERTLLDFGSGTGDFLVASKNCDWLAMGVEPNPRARKLAEAKGVHVCSEMDRLKNGKFKVITLWHVLEHLPNLEEQITQLISKLDNTGILVIAVPNFRSYDAKHYGQCWAAYDVPRHLWHFSRNAMEKLFSRHKMKIIEIRPMFFDAFYVAMLSEKYKTGRTNFIKACCIGLWSNIKALGSGEYSSLIYILQNA